MEVARNNTRTVETSDAISNMPIVIGSITQRKEIGGMTKHKSEVYLGRY